jgi:hypothetical protein
VSHFSRRLSLLAMRRAQLVQQAAEQRQQLATAAAPLARAFCWVDRGAMAWALLRRQPWLIAVPVALLVWWRPRGLVQAGTVLATWLWHRRAASGLRT